MVHRRGEDDILAPLPDDFVEGEDGEPIESAVEDIEELTRLRLRDLAARRAQA